MWRAVFGAQDGSVDSCSECLFGAADRLVEWVFGDESVDGRAGLGCAGGGVD
jgi:hypothetical protein